MHSHANLIQVLHKGEGRGRKSAVDVQEYAWRTQLLLQEVCKTSEFVVSVYHHLRLSQQRRTPHVLQVNCDFSFLGWTDSRIGARLRGGRR